MTTSRKGFFERKNIEISLKRYFVDAMGNMALGLFASLLIGTILKTIGQQADIDWLIEISNYTTQAQGAAMAVAIAWALKAPPLVMFSCATVGVAGNALGGPLGALLATIVATECGKVVSKETKVDIIVTPTVTILIGCAVAGYIGPYVSKIMYAFGDVINTATEMQPLYMGILVSVVVGVVLTLPISSAALCIMLGLSGLAGGAAVAGCSAQMVGFAVASYRENKMGGLLAQGLGTSMLQVPNIFRRPQIWLAPTLAAAFTGPIATLIFKLEISSELSVAAGMGTCGLVGPIGLLSSMGSNTNTWLGILVVCFVAPAMLAYAFDTAFRKLGIVKFGDQKLDL
ncbi:MAG: PTS sugar transporter subunit IIC [Clostridia bacterium]